MDFKKILIINLGGMGDTILAVPFFRAARRSYPESEITIWCVSRVEELLSGLPYYDHLRPVNFPGELHINFSPLKFFRFIAFIIGLRKERFDLIINMLPLVSALSALKMKLIFYLLNPEFSAGRNTEGRGKFYSAAVDEKDTHDEYDLNIFSKLARLCGFEIKDRAFEVPRKNADFEFVNGFLRSRRVNEGELLIGMNPGSDWPSRRWEIKNYVRLAAMLLNSFECKIVVTGTVAESELAGEILKVDGERVISAAGSTSLGQLAELIRRCNLYITNDSGPMHLSLAVGTPL
ncbi:MAG: glycosyltransferase family 9 protein, partial [Fidelibacterota bacterium]